MTSFTATYGGHPFTLELDLTVSSQNYVGNYSTISYSLETIKTGNFTPYRTDSAATWAFNYVGSGNWGPYSFNGGIGQSITMASGSFNVTHASDGTCTLSPSFSANADSTITTASGSGTMVLPTIPQAPGAPTIGTFTDTSSSSATLTWTAPTSTGGSAITGYMIEYATNSSFTSATTISVGNVTSYNITGLTPGAQYWAKVAAVNAAITGGVTPVYSGSVSVVIVATIGDLDGWSSFGTLPTGTSTIVSGALRRGSVYVLSGGTTGLLREVQATSSSGGPTTIDTLGIQRTMTTTIGTTYHLDANAVALQTTNPDGNKYRFNVSGIGHGSTVTLTAETPVAIPTYSFTATSTSTVVQIQLDQAVSWTSAGWFESAGFYGITLTEIPATSGSQLQDIAYEGPLSNHFTYACDSVGAAWWVDRTNTTQFVAVPGATALKAYFSDSAADTSAISYTAINASYDTRNTINSLSVTNHGRNASTGDTNDLTFTANATTSVTTYGLRSGSLDMELRAGYVDETNLFLDPAGAFTAGGGFGVQACTVDQNDATWSVAGPTSLNLYSSTNTDSYLSLTNVTGGLPYGMVPGNTYVVSATGNTKVAFTGTSGPRAQRICVFYRTGSGAYTEVDSTGVISNTINTPSRLSVEFTPPVGTTEIFFRFYHGGAASGPGQIRWDAFRLSPKNTAAGADNVSYWDGSTTDSTGTYAYQWTGTVNASSSQRLTYAVVLSRIAAVLAATSTPTRVISSITFNAQSSPTLAALLDVQDRVRVTFRGQVQDSRIVGIEHTMSGSNWMVTLDLVAG